MSGYDSQAYWLETANLSYGEINAALDALGESDPDYADKQSSLLERLMCADMAMGPSRKAMKAAEQPSAPKPPGESPRPLTLRERLEAAGCPQAPSPNGGGMIICGIGPPPRPPADPAQRLRQFADYLRLMGKRVHEVQGNCFSIFEDRSRTPDRFVQFAFEEHRFFLEVSLPTLSRAEAEQILQERHGFFWLRDRPEFAVYLADCEGLEPLWKIYAYADELSAAEDLAYIFFEVWKLPAGSRLYVRSSTFNGPQQWEENAPMA